MLRAVGQEPRGPKHWEKKIKIFLREWKFKREGNLKARMKFSSEPHGKAFLYSLQGILKVEIAIFKWKSSENEAHAKTRKM